MGERLIKKLMALFQHELNIPLTEPIITKNRMIPTIQIDLMISILSSLTRKVSLRLLTQKKLQILQNQPIAALYSLKKNVIFRYEYNKSLV